MNFYSARRTPHTYNTRRRERAQKVTSAFSSREGVKKLVNKWKSDAGHWIVIWPLTTHKIRANFIIMGKIRNESHEAIRGEFLVPAQNIQVYVLMHIIL